MAGYAERMLNQYRQTRLLMFTMTRLWGDTKKPVKSPEALWPLPGDDAAAGMPTKDDIAAMFDKLKKKDG